MNIIITAGGTSEKIDEVRVISNFSTGKLGLEVARAFLDSRNSGIEKIYYLCDKNTITPNDPRVEVVRVSGVQGLLDGLKGILTTKKIDAVIHAMAVSDYTVRTVTTLEELKSSNCECEEISKREGKISSDIDDLVIILKKTPKVIGEIKKFQKETLLVGFKLLTKVEHEILIDTGYKLLQKNDCDMVLANDLTEITGEQHIGYLIFPDREYIKLNSKKQIAETIVVHIEKMMTGKERK